MRNITALITVKIAVFAPMPSARVMTATREVKSTMALILLVLLLALILGGLGFAIHWLWIIAAIVFLFWLVGFGFSRGATSGGARWYRW